MKNILTNIVYLLVGVMLGYLIFALNRCNIKPVEPIVETKVDTITYEVKVEVPKYRTKYITRTDSFYQTKFDSIEKWAVITIPDTTPIEIHEYIDSIKTEDYRFDYTIETLGHLIHFDPKFTVYTKTPVPVKKCVKPKWMISGAVSNELNWKLGFGYKGWTAEGVFKRGFKELYIGKQITF